MDLNLTFANGGFDIWPNGLSEGQKAFESVSQTESVEAIGTDVFAQLAGKV